MKKHFFLFFIILFSPFLFLDVEVEDYINSQHKEIFSFLNDNQELFANDKTRFLDQFEKRFSKLIPPEEISKRVMGKKFFNLATKEQVTEFNEKFKSTLLDSYSGALGNIDSTNISIDSYKYLSEQKNKAVVYLNTEFSGQKFKLIYKMMKLKMDDASSWRVVGIVLDGIDLVSIYRKQFITLVKENNNDLDSAIESWSIDEDSLISNE